MDRLAGHDSELEMRRRQIEIELANGRFPGVKDDEGVREIYLEGQTGLVQWVDGRDGEKDIRQQVGPGLTDYEITAELDRAKGRGKNSREAHFSVGRIVSKHLRGRVFSDPMTFEESRDQILPEM